ncbi:MAG TPA: oxidoreductase [Rhodospirillaceae bacterium]|nr:oxidoreductase [Rhodospirillaceae bacterium]
MTTIAVIGAGYWGKNLIRNFKEMGRLVAICETDSAQRAEIQNQYPDVPIVDTIEQILDDAAIDAVAVATPAATHGEVVEKSIAAGKDVFVEKPLCLDLNQAATLKKQADDAKRTLMVGHLLLYHPAFISLSRAVADGQVGQLRYIYSNRTSLGKIRKEENALWSFAPHDISMMLALTGQFPSRVVSSGGTYLYPPVADTSLTHLTFEDGVQGHIFVSWLHPFKEHRTVVVGSEGMAVFDDVEQGDQKLMLYRHKVGWQGDIAAINKAVGEPISYEEREPLRIECEHFIDCVATRNTPRTDATEAIRVLQVLDACQKSLSNGDPIHFDSSNS